MRWAETSSLRTEPFSEIIALSDFLQLNHLINSLESWDGVGSRIDQLSAWSECLPGLLEPKQGHMITTLLLSRPQLPWQTHRAEQGKNFTRALPSTAARAQACLGSFLCSRCPNGPGCLCPTPLAPHSSLSWVSKCDFLCFFFLSFFIVCLTVPRLHLLGLHKELGAPALISSLPGANFRVSPCRPPQHHIPPYLEPPWWLVLRWWEMPGLAQSLLVSF